MPLACPTAAEECFSPLSDSLIEELTYVYGLNDQGCRRYEEVTDFFDRLETPFTGTGENGIAIEYPTLGETHDPVISFDPCLWNVPGGEVLNVLGEDPDGCKVTEILADFIERTETALELVSSDGSLEFTLSGIADHEADASVHLATNQGAGDNQIILVPGVDGGIYVPPFGPDTETHLLANDSATINFTTSGVSDHTLTGSVRLSAVSGNLLTAEADGLFLEIESTTIPISETDTNTINITATGLGNHEISADVIIDPDADNILTATVDGLFVSSTAAIQTPLSVVDTPTTNVSLSGANNHTIEVDVTIDPAGDNILTATVDGLYVPNNASLQTPITGTDSDTVSWSISGTDDHTIEANVRVSADDCNALEIHSDPGDPGLYVLLFQGGYRQVEHGPNAVLVSGELADLLGDGGGGFVYNDVIFANEFAVVSDCDRTGWLRAEIQTVPLKLTNTVLSQIIVRREYRIDGGAWLEGRAGEYEVIAPVGTQTHLIPEEWVDFDFINSPGSHTLQVRITWSESVTGPFVSFSGSITILPFSTRIQFYDDTNYETLIIPD